MTEQRFRKGLGGVGINQKEELAIVRDKLASDVASYEWENANNPMF